MGFSLISKMDSISVDKYLNGCTFTTTKILTLILLIIISLYLLRNWSSSRVKNGKPIPGPTCLPILGYLPVLGREPYKKLQQMQRTYGNIIGLYFGSKYTIVLNEYSVVKEVMGHPGAQDRAPDIFEFVSKSGFHLLNGEKWIEQRRFCNSATRDVGLGRGHWEDLIMEETKKLTDKLKATKGQPIDISHNLCASVLSNILFLLIGRRLNEDEEADKIQVSMEFVDCFSYLGPAMPASFIPILRKFCEVFKIAGFDKALKTVKSFAQFIEEEIYRHKNLAGVKDNKDFMSLYLKKISELEKSKNEDHCFSESMLHGNVVAMFLAASDTVFKSLCWFLRLMAANQAVQNNIYTELIGSVGMEGRARYEEREKFPYTFATIMESQRFSSIVPFSSNRRANQDILINGMTIPKGSDIVANLWALHHDPDYWDQPEMFNPDRFLEDNGRRLTKNVKSYFPFSYGRRNCPGSSIAYMTILLYASEIMKKFEICLPQGEHPEFKVTNGLVTGLEPQLLCFKERRNVALRNIES